MKHPTNAEIQHEAAPSEKLQWSLGQNAPHCIY
jgi:hypothetical protein